MKIKEVDINNINNLDTGRLSFIQWGDDIPFDVKRIYYITEVKAGVTRGFHSHRTLRQFMFCPYGKIRLSFDDGISTEDYILDTPYKGLIIEPGIWRTMTWLQDNSVLCVAASEKYDEADYIRDYSLFLESVKK